MNDDPRAAIRRELERVLAGKPHASLDELQEALNVTMRGYNLRPQSELGALSPNEVHRLIAADWESPDSAIRPSTSVPMTELGDALRLHDARVLLQLIADSAPVKATPKGNLPRVLVAQFRERAIAHAAEREHGLPPVAVRNEEDHWPLHITRILLELAKLLVRRKGVFLRTKLGDRMSEPARMGELYALLLRTQFRAFNLAYLDLGEPFPEFQDTIGVAVAQFGRLEPRWYGADELVDRLFLPSVRASAPRHHLYDPTTSILKSRFLTPLVAFGLSQHQEEGERWKAGEPWRDRDRYRRSPLWERVWSVR